MKDVAKSVKFARDLRRSVLDMIYAAKSSHIGGAFSAADILAVLYESVLKIDPANPRLETRDRLIFSKGHAAAALYSALALKGFFPKDWLKSYCKNDGQLGGHVSSYKVPGVEFSTGSLGHGLPVACGMAFALRREKNPGRVFVILSDGEMDEGTTWEAALLANQHKLSNLTVVVDYNKIQSFGRVDDVLKLDPLADKWRAFGWEAMEADGHDHGALCAALTRAHEGPLVVIAHTVKGKGVSFMQDKLEWHYRPPREDEYAAAVAELEKEAGDA